MCKGCNAPPKHHNRNNFETTPDAGVLDYAEQLL